MHNGLLLVMPNNPGDTVMTDTVIERSRRCLICSNINPCRQHSAGQQSTELQRNMSAVERLYDDSQPLLAQLQMIARDASETDRVRAVCRAAIAALTPTVPDDELRMVAAQRVYDTMDGRVGMLEAQMLVGIVAEALAQSKPSPEDMASHYKRCA